MGVICSSCGRDIDALGQDNMSCTSEPLCEDCFSDRLGHAAPMARSLVERERERLAVRDELDRLRRENEALKRDPVTPAQALAHARELAEDAYAECPERRAALERLEECAMWMGRCRPRETAAPAHGEAAGGPRSRSTWTCAPTWTRPSPPGTPMEYMRKLMLRSAVE